jgi:hypothetical protein
MPGRAARLATVVLATLAALIAATGASAADPGRWQMTGYSQVPLEYFQGVTSDPHKNLYFDGFTVGLYRTDRSLVEERRNSSAIPLEVIRTEGYNHIGDITWDRAEGGRLLLPLECFFFVVGNFCKTGSLGVADPETVQWRYYVKLDPAFIDKAMWAEVQPGGKLVWTSSGSGDDLLAYRTAEVRPENAAPSGPELRPVRVLKNAVPPSGITGATFFGGRLLVAGQDTGVFQIWSIDTKDGSRRLELERPDFVGESEGLDNVNTLGGKLHWLITPFRTRGRPPTFGLTSALVHFKRAGD